MKRYNETIKTEIADFYKQKHSMSECAKKFNISKASVRLWLNEMQIARTPKEGTRLYLGTGQRYREKHPNWKGGRWIGKDGYIVLNHGSKHTVRNEQYEHRFVAEKVLSRKLKPKECVHHINGIRSDNRHCNLLVCTNAYHNFLNNRMATLYVKEHFKN